MLVFGNTIFFFWFARWVADEGRQNANNLYVKFLWKVLRELAEPINSSEPNRRQITAKHVSGKLVLVDQ